MNPFDVPANELIEAVADDLKNNLRVEQPNFAPFVKTAPSKERVPMQRDWYYKRLASMLYRLLKEGTLGVGALRTYYGSKKNRGRRKHKFMRAGGKIIRHGLQQLETLGFVKKVQKGRILTPKGQQYLSKIASKTKKNWEEKIKVALQQKELGAKKAIEEKSTQKKDAQKQEKGKEQKQPLSEKKQKSTDVISELKEKLAKAPTENKYAEGKVSE
ncbi:MAG: 30S ribosomal protein S19e [Candidatus Diapherotrites archaeon]|nr:30S ribosomal protein S19e [Candidatus Diapherotrites archaeon]